MVFFQMIVCRMMDAILPESKFLIQNFRMTSRAIKKLVLNPKAFQKSAAIHRVKASTEDGKVAKQSDDYAEFDQSLQELPEFASVQKQE